MLDARQLHPILMGSGGISLINQANSSSRTQMSISHSGQALVIEGCTPRRMQTGVEREYGKYTFSIKIPCDAKILRIIEKYPKTLGKDIIYENPKTLIIYEDIYSKEVGSVEIDRYHCEHQYFGFSYVLTEEGKKISEGSYVKEGTILADSPTIDKNKNWRYGIESNVVMMSVPAIIEDGVVVRRGFLEKLKTKGFESRIGNFGKNMYPLNLYGDKDNYKPFPDIGDRIRSDGLIMAFRTYDDLLGPLDMTTESLMEVDHIFDKTVYAKPNGKVIDISVNHNKEGGFYPTPSEMTGQVNKYDQAARVYYNKIIDFYKSLRDKLKITPCFHRLVVEAYSYINDPGNPKSQGKINYTYRRAPLDDYRIEITFEYDIVPNIGFKITGTSGDKSVIVDIWDDADMPTDENGNVADIIMDGDSTVKRMNVSRMYEQYINAASRDLTDNIRKQFGFDKNMPKDIQIRGFSTDKNKENLYVESFNKLKRYYEIISPKMHATIKELESKDVSYFKHHVNSILDDGIYLWIPTDNPVNLVEMIKSIRNEFPAHFGPITYRGRSGNLVKTVTPILIGSLYVMLLEKTGSEWSAVSSAKLQHFGIPAKLSNSDKHSTPVRGSPVRILGESEVRLFCSTVGGDTTMEILDQSNNPLIHKRIFTNILLSEYPTKIKSIIDRKEFPRGKSRALVYMKHTLQCAGIKFTNEGSI